MTKEERALRNLVLEALDIKAIRLAERIVEVEKARQLVLDRVR